jgi:protein-S-isoprenylcysteine O-methyltransferase Ste14
MWPLFAAAAALLSVERIVYIRICRRPADFRAWCETSSVWRDQDPVDVVRVLFYVFKAVQAGVFLFWFYLLGNGQLWPPPGGASVTVLGAMIVLFGQALAWTALARLGQVGTFYGAQLGRDVRWQAGFPYSMFRHPVYLGAAVSIWGLFIAMRFPAPDWSLIPLIETAYYIAGSYLER